MEMNLIDFQMQQIVICVTSPEGLELNAETVGSLDPDVGDLLLSTCRKLNGTTPSERANFLEQSEEEKVTTG